MTTPTAPSIAAVAHAKAEHDYRHRLYREHLGQCASVATCSTLRELCRVADLAGDAWAAAERRAVGA